MKVTVTKTWETTEEIEVTDGLTKDQLIQHLDNAVLNVAGNMDNNAVWQWTSCTEADGSDIVVFD